MCSRKEPRLVRAAQAHLDLDESGDALARGAARVRAIRAGSDTRRQPTRLANRFEAVPCRSSAGGAPIADG